MERPSMRGLTLVLLQRFAWRHWIAAPRQTAVLVLILALGVGGFLAIRLANRAVLASFGNFTELLTQASDWIIQAPAGYLSESILSELRGRLGSRPVRAVPVLETTAARPSRDPDEPIGARETFQVLGVDLIGIQNLAARQALDRSWFGQTSVTTSATQAGGSERFWQVLRNPRATFVSQELSTREGLQPGSSLEVVINERIVTLEVAGILPCQAGMPQPPATLLVMDLPAVQALIGRAGQLSRIEFLVEEGPDADSRRAELAERLDEWSGGRWHVGSPASRRDHAATMTRAFRLNLTILSLIALLVGLYLIFQALDGAVVRRREEIAILRSLGVEERWIRRAWLWEAGVLGIVGGAFGSLIGWSGAQFAVRLVGRSVNALYYSVTVDSAQLHWGELATALVLAVVTSLLVGWLPARAAARTPPAQILVRHALEAPGLPLWRKEWLGAGLVVAGVVLAFLPPWRFPGGVRFPLAGYGAALAWILGGGILGGWTLRMLARAGRPLGTWSIPWRLAAGHLTEPSGRHRLAVAGLVCAVSMTAAMAILVASFEATMQGWIERFFQADLFVSSSGAQSASTENRIAPETWKRLVAHPAVEDADVVQACEVELAEGRTLLSGGDLGVARRRLPLPWLQPPETEDVFDVDRNAELALVSESFSERFRRYRGDRLRVPTPAGERELTIAGVFCDYGNERGSILVDRRHFAAWFRDEQASGLMVFLRPGASAESLRTEWLSAHPGLRVFGNAHLRSEIMRIFRQTFAITYALEIIGVFVAMVGLGLTLGSVLLERRAELTTLRALGLRHVEIAQATACEGLGLAMAGVVAGLAVSVGLGWLLVHVINKQTFGWTLMFRFPGLPLAGLVVGVLAVAGAVAYGVGRWGARLPADREE